MSRITAAITRMPISRLHEAMTVAMPAPPTEMPKSLDAHMKPFTRPRSDSLSRSIAIASVATS